MKKATGHSGRQARRRGTAMTEFVLVLPVLVFILGLLLFLGWSLMRRQHVVAAGRYAVWRQIEGQPADGATLNDRVLGGAAQNVDPRIAGGPDDAIDGWVRQAGDQGVGPLADELLRRRWPGGSELRLEVRYDPPTWLGRQFGNDFTTRSAREGLPWARGQASPWNALTDLYYDDLDDHFANVPPEARPMADTLQSLYGAQW